MSEFAEDASRKKKKRLNEDGTKKRRKKVRKSEDAEVEQEGDGEDIDVPEKEIKSKAARNRDAQTEDDEQEDAAPNSATEAADAEPEPEIERTDFKVFVSRMPPKWDVAKIKEYFTSLFGEVVSVELFSPNREEKVEIRKDIRQRVCYAFLKGECSRGEHCQFSHDTASGTGKGAGLKGIVYFRTQASVDAALAKETFHISARNVRISKFQSTEDGRDASSCYAWGQFNCTRGDQCKFSHEGPGGCVKVSAPGQGRAFTGGLCLSFKTKGKCSKGDSCPFQHVQREREPKAAAQLRGADGAGESASGKSATSGSGVCNDFRRAGKCRKGDRCKYAHVAK
jgi:hypothetical protein